MLDFRKAIVCTKQLLFTYFGERKKKMYSKVLAIIDRDVISTETNKGRITILDRGGDLDNSERNRTMVTLKNNNINSVLSIMKQMKSEHGLVFYCEDGKN